MPRARRGPTRCSGDRGPTPLVPAVGGTRQVPEPDAIARDYLLLGLRLDQHAAGLVDGYFGPAALKAEVDMGQLRAPARLRDDAAALRARLADEVAEADRRTWLDAQLVALETQAAALAGDGLPYEAHVDRCIGFAPPRRPDREFDEARATIDAQLPGDGPLADRLAAWDRTLEIDGRAAAGGHRLARRAASARGPPPTSGCPTARTCASGSSATSRGVATTGSTAAGAPGSTSTPTSRCARRRSSTRWPTRRTRATTSSTPGRRPSWSIGSAGWRRASCSSTRPNASSARAWPTSAWGSPIRRRTGSTCWSDLFERAGLPWAA